MNINLTGQPVFCQDARAVLASRLPRRTAAGAACGSLTARQRELLALIALEPLAADEIAQRLDIAVATAERHLADIYRKLSASNRAEAVRAFLAAPP